MIKKFLWICIIFEVVDTQNQYYNNRQQTQQQPNQQNPQYQQWQQQRQAQQSQYNRPGQTNQGQQFYLGGNQQQQQPGYPGQSGYNNQYGQQQYNQNSGSSQVGLLSTPIRQRYDNFSNVNGATLYYKINAYSNPGMTMPNGKTCACPSGSCTFLQNVPYPCLIAFAAIMTSADQNVQYIASDFVPYNASTGTLAYGNWNNDNNVQMATKPQSIDIFVHNLGVVIDKGTGNLVYFNYLTLVDTFVIDLRNYSPATSSGVSNQTNQTYRGQNVQSTLDFSFYVQCQSGYIGPLCDLQCNTGTGDGTHVVCTSTITNQQSVCNYTDSTKTQVGNCQVCINGVYNNTCADIANAYNLESNKVNKSYKVWTIVLGVLLGLAVLFIFLLLILFVIQRRQKEKQPTTNYQRQQYNAGYNSRAPNTMTNPLLEKNDEWSRPNPPTAMTRGPQTDLETTQSSEAPRNGHLHYTRREAEV